MANNKKKPNYIVYTSRDEFIVCKPKFESEMIKDWFNKGGRNLEDFDRREIFDEVFNIGSGDLKLHW